MGANQCYCCQPQLQSTQLPETKKNVEVVQLVEPAIVPQLLPPVKKHLDQNKNLLDKLPNIRTKRKLKNNKDIYEGTINHKKQPHGYGQIFFNNGAVFIGKFQNGMAQGRGHFIFADGSFYDGNMINNKAQTEKGKFQNSWMKYHGGFEDNKFHGKGSQIGENYSFEGDYDRGLKTQGTLKYKINRRSQNQTTIQEQYVYSGKFNSKGKFQGKGKLNGPKGQFEGDFVNGKKHGYGVFNYVSGIRYEGNYVNNLKEGEGILYTKKNLIKYSGQWKQNLPNGKGFIINEYGDKVQRIWKNGIDQSRIIQGQNLFNSK